MEAKTILAINVTNDGLEVRMTEEVYGNLGLVGLLEKIKVNLLQDMPETLEVLENNKPNQKYEA